jgi:GxxExxY protein
MENDEQSFQIIGGAMDVHREMGSQQPEIVYRMALIEEMKARAVPVTESAQISVTYKEKKLECLDVPYHLVCFGDILVEVKNVPKLLAEDQKNLSDDLPEAGCSRGLLLNFTKPRLEIRRVAKSTAPPPLPPVPTKPKHAKTL